MISRGYGRNDESKICVVGTDSQACGDEPVLIKQKAPGSQVIVGAVRYEAGKIALNQFNPGVLILDDGFQHIQLQRTTDIVLIDARDPFGNNKLFPAGILREPVASLRRAHAILITNVEEGCDTAGLQDRIRTLTEARIFTSHLEPIDVINCGSGKTQPLSALQGRVVLALSGIARPASFLKTLMALGASVSVECIYPDHYAFNANDLAEVQRKALAAKADMIITTEKDAVRLRGLGVDNIFALRVALTIHEADAWTDFLLSSLGDN